MNKICVILLCFPALLFGQQTIIKEIKIMPYMYTQNYEHFKRLVFESPDSEAEYIDCLLYTSPSPRDRQKSRMPSSA